MLAFYLQMIDTDEEKSQFETVYTEYRELLHCIANRILKDPQLSEDAVQEAFFSLAKNIKKFHSQPNEKIRSYLSIIVRNAAFRIYNQNKQECTVDYMETISDPFDLETVSEQKELMKQLFRILKTLDRKYADVLVLRYYHNLREAEIARALKITPENVKVRIHRGKKFLRESLEKENKDNKTKV